MSGSRRFTVRQVYYAGVGWASAAYCIAFACAIGCQWQSCVLLLFASVCACYAVRNVGLVYVLDEEGLAICSRWGTLKQIRWSSVRRMKFFEQDMTLGVLLKDGKRLPIRCGALHEPEAFRKEVRRLAYEIGVKMGIS
jgi:hypothetical protein